MWSSSRCSNTVHTLPRDVIVYSVIQYRIYTIKRRGRLVRVPIPFIHYQQTWSSSRCSNTVHTLPRDVAVYSCSNIVHTLRRDVVVQSVLQYRTYTTKRRGRLSLLQYRTYTTKRRGRLILAPMMYIHYQETCSSSPCSNTVGTIPRDVVV